MMNLPDWLVDDCFPKVSDAGVRLTVALVRHGQRKSVPGAGQYAAWTGSYPALGQKALLGESTVRRTERELVEKGFLVAFWPGFRAGALVYHTALLPLERASLTPHAARIAHRFADNLSNLSGDFDRELEGENASSDDPWSPRPWPAMRDPATLAEHGGEEWSTEDVIYALEHHDLTLDALGAAQGRTKKAVMAMYLRHELRKPSPRWSEEVRAPLVARIEAVLAGLRGEGVVS